MNCIKKSILMHVRLRAPHTMKGMSQMMCTSTTGSNPDHEIMDRVIGLVKKFDRIDPAKVTEKADFQKDLSLDSLDKVELVMAVEQEFSIEIPEEEADELTCCVDVAKYITSATQGKTTPEKV